MTDSVVPGQDLAQVQHWCSAKVPARVRDKVRVECEVNGRDLAVVEFHALSGPGGSDEWVGTPIARLRYLRSRGIWRLYWVDSNDRWHEYPDLPWAHDVSDLLDEMDRDPTALFWG